MHEPPPLPLTRASVQLAHDMIYPWIQLTPVLTNRTLSELASTPQSPAALVGTPWEGQPPAQPTIRLFFKCENLQRIGAFKIRGATHAVVRLMRAAASSENAGAKGDGGAWHPSKGVVTHSSGNHAQALSLAALENGIPAYIVMPSISTPTKIAATRGYGAEVIFSGSTAPEREAVVKEVQARTGAWLVPPYDHRDILLGQGTVGLELERQAREIIMRKGGEGGTSCPAGGYKVGKAAVEGDDGIHEAEKGQPVPEGMLNAVIAPLGGGGLLSGIATALGPTPTLVFGAEPSFQGADDGRRGLAATPPTRITSVKTLTIADGLRTPVGEITWRVISDKKKVEGVYSVTEEQIKAALRLVLERMKVMIEPSAAVGLAVCLFDEGFRQEVEKKGGEKGWDVGVVFSGGNTSVEAIGALFSGEGKEKGHRGEERAEGKVGLDGESKAENLAG